MFEQLEEKRSYDQALFPLKIDKLGVCFNDRTFHIFCNGWIGCRDTFHAVLRL